MQKKGEKTMTNHEYETIQTMLERNQEILLRCAEYLDPDYPDNQMLNYLGKTALLTAHMEMNVKALQMLRRQNQKEGKNNE